MTPLSEVFSTTGDAPLTISLCVERSYFELIDRQALKADFAGSHLQSILNYLKKN